MPLSKLWPWSWDGIHWLIQTNQDLWPLDGAVPPWSSTTASAQVGFLKCYLSPRNLWGLSILRCTFSLKVMVWVTKVGVGAGVSDLVLNNAPLWKFLFIERDSLCLFRTGFQFPLGLWSFIAQVLRENMGMIIGRERERAGMGWRCTGEETYEHQ